MEAIRQILYTLDITYAIVCLIAIPLGCYLFVMYIPTIMLVVFFIFGVLQIALIFDASLIERVRGTFHLIYYVVGVVGLYWFCAERSLATVGLCEDLSGYIPGTMASWVQTFVPHTCPPR